VQLHHIRAIVPRLMVNGQWQRKPLAMTPQQAEFTARLARIEAAAGKRSTTLYVGPDESYVLDRPVRRRNRSALLVMMGNAAYPLSLVLSFLVGFLAFGIGRYIRFHLTGAADAPPDPDTEMLIEVCSGLVIAAMLGQFDRMKSFEYLVAKSLGVVVALLTFHNLVHEFPEQFKMLFSPIWVTKVVTQTEPFSLVWRGISFTF
jgi:hypothetical protein